VRTALLAVLFVRVGLGQPGPAGVVSEDPVIRRDALRKLAALPESERVAYVPELIARVKGPWQERARVRLAFAKIGPAAVPRLTSLAGDADEADRLFAAQTLAMIRPVAPSTLRLIKASLQDRSNGVRFVAAESLASLGLEDDEIRKTLQSLGGGIVEITDPKRITAVLENLDSDDPKRRSEAAQVLLSLPHYWPGMDAACIRALKRPSAKVREAAKLILQVWFTEGAQDALLDYEIAEVARKKAAAKIARRERTGAHTLDEIEAVIPPDFDSEYPFKPAGEVEIRGYDGTSVLAIVYTGRERNDRLRVWERAGNEYFFITEKTAGDPSSHLAVESFRYGGKRYLHTTELQEGTGNFHKDELCRVEAGGLTKLSTPKGLPFELGPGEGVLKGFAETFRDDKLTFRFGIWKPGDANCCPSGGIVDGTYKIAGNALVFDTWKRER
jgi:hypothetical protein